MSDSSASEKPHMTGHGMPDSISLRKQQAVDREEYGMQGFRSQVQGLEMGMVAKMMVLFSSFLRNKTDKAQTLA